MTSKSAAKMVRATPRQGQAFKDRSKPADIRQSNINAAKGMIRIFLNKLQTI
jgi:hypothetical protein